MNYNCRIKLKSDLGCARAAINDILFEINSFLEEDNKYDLKLMLSELVNNGIIHGNKNDSNKSIVISLQISEEFIKASVMDEGQGFDWKKPFIPETEDERGRGLLLVAGVSDTFEIKGNQVIVTKRI